MISSLSFAYERCELEPAKEREEQQQILGCRRRALARRSRRSWLCCNGSFACDYQLCISVHILNPKYLDFLGAGSGLRVLCFCMFCFYLIILLMNKQKEGFTPA